MIVAPALSGEFRARPSYRCRDSILDRSRHRESGRAEESED